MRIPITPPGELSGDRLALYNAFLPRARAYSSLFRTQREDGALLGPWSVWLQTPVVGETVRRLVEAIATLPGLSKSATQAVILATVSHFDGSYELNAHSLVGAASGLTPAQVGELAGGGVPPDLDQEVRVAVITARRLLRGGVIPLPLYRMASAILGEDGYAAVVYLVGQYCLVSACLNAYDVEVPDQPS